ncbi:MAG: trypsin-like peptidase domain-containing protein [Tropicimonas sp.]|uniref:trypsin-like peptidase domain-containing protein n=1 Tax=Tropicimonas sp. TaxID=2067044 RepID=UPI003A85BDDB
MKALLLVLATLTLLAQPGASPAQAPAQAPAQDSAWIQVEALRSLAEGEARARSYAGAFANVAGFRLGSGWHAIALGPYSSAAAEAELRSLKRQRLIPSDSYLVAGRDYAGGQFWPIGANSLSLPPVESTATPEPDMATTGMPQEPADLPDETLREARASEGRLDGEARRLLQRGLNWDGHYDATIDGAFGPGTRAAMAAWQQARGHEATGVLTTRQRAELVAGYLAALEELDLGLVRDEEAGIEMILPRGRLARGRIEAPFVHYDSTSEGSGLRLLLISQSGDEATLFGLYDIMQTLEIVPPAGHRERQQTSFVLTGQSPGLNSHTTARLADGAVKGFTLIWEPADEALARRLLAMMEESFTPVAGIVLPDSASSDDGTGQQPDLLSGLEIRRPALSRSGFFIDDAGRVLTTTDGIAQCHHVTIGEEIEAEVTASDEALGLVLLSPRQPLAPLAVAEFATGLPRLKSEVALAGFAYEDILSLPVLTYGTLEDLRGLEGEEFVRRLELSSLPGDAGGPVFDSSGAVLGMLRARDEDGQRRLPQEVNFAVDVTAIADFLSRFDLAPRAARPRGSIAPEDLTALAGDITVRVSCWN